MPNYNEIRKMSDKELNLFLVDIQRSNKRICNKCGGFILNKTTVSVRRDYTAKTLCTLCENCYADVLEFIGINDVDWN